MSERLPDPLDGNVDLNVLCVAARADQGHVAAHLTKCQTVERYSATRFATRTRPGLQLVHKNHQS